MRLEEDLGHAVGSNLYLVCRNAALNETVPHKPTRHPDLIDKLAQRRQPGMWNAAVFPGLNDDPMSVLWRCEIGRPLMGNVDIDCGRKGCVDSGAESIRKRSIMT